MSQQQETSQSAKDQSPKVILAIVISALITALAVGGGFYLFQKSGPNVSYSDPKSQQQIQLLQDQIKALKKENADSELITQPVLTISPTAPNNIKFPIVVYGRPGLFNNTDEGKAEKKKLEEKLIDPYTDYQNEDGINLVAIYVTIPQNIGEEYSVLGIFGSEKRYGTDQFSFGKREQEYGFWKPECMGKCEFSEAFKAKYPQIVE